MGSKDWLVEEGERIEVEWLLKFMWVCGRVLRFFNHGWREERNNLIHLGIIDGTGAAGM